jgi:hypothetical protein
MKETEGVSASWQTRGAKPLDLPSLVPPFFLFPRFQQKHLAQKQHNQLPHYL